MRFALQRVNVVVTVFQLSLKFFKLAEGRDVLVIIFSRSKPTCLCACVRVCMYVCVFVCAASQDQLICYLACVRIACKAGTIPDESTIEKTGQSLLNFLAGFLRVRAPAGKICESVPCSTTVNLIISLSSESHRRLLRSWADPDEASILCSLCSSLSFCESSEKSIVSISEKLGSTEWPFPIHRFNDTGTTNFQKVGKVLYLQMIGKPGALCVGILRLCSESMVLRHYNAIVRRPFFCHASIPSFSHVS